MPSSPHGAIPRPDRTPLSPDRRSRNGYGFMRVVRAKAGGPVFGFPHLQKSECPIRRSDVVGQPGCVTGRGGEERYE